MHELSIATSIVDTVLQKIQRKNLPPVQVIAVRIGALILWPGLREVAS